MIVAVEHHSGEFGGVLLIGLAHGDGRWRAGHGGHADFLPLIHPGGGFGALAIDADLPAAQHFLQRALGESGVVPLEPAVEPCAGIAGFDGNGEDSHRRSIGQDTAKGTRSLLRRGIASTLLTWRTAQMQRISRRAAALGLAMASPALAQWAPARSIRLIAPYPPGGGVDTTSRLMAGPMAALLGQPVVVENRAGAGGSLGAAELARSAPDGLTVMVDALAHTVNPALIRNLPFDYATAFTPITQLAVLPQILIVPNALPVRDLAGFIAYFQARPGAAYGSSGNATAAHMASALLLGRAGLRMEHVPYRGGTAALPDVIAGNVNFIFGTVSSSLQLVREGRVRALGVSTARRIPSLPDVPTIAEQGFAGFELNEWNGFWAPAGCRRRWRPGCMRRRCMPWRMRVCCRGLRRWGRLRWAILRLNSPPGLRPSGR